MGRILVSKIFSNATASRRALWALAASAGCLGAQTAPLSGPVEAFTFDRPAAGFRAIEGRLGAALLGPSLLRGVEFGSVAPQKDYALGFGRGRGTLVTGLATGRPVSMELTGAFPTPDKVVWSADGSLAILYSFAGNWMQTLRGFPGNVTANSSISVASLGGSVSTVATDAHGARIMIGITGQNGTGGVYELTPAGNFVPLLATPAPQSLAFSSDGGTLYALDGASHQLSILNLAGGAPESWSLAGLNDPFAIRVAPDATQKPVLYVAGRADRLLVAYDPATRQAVGSWPLDAAPDGIEPLGVNSFVLHSRTSAQDPLWSFTSSPAMGVYFVPGTSSENLPSSLREGRTR